MHNTLLAQWFTLTCPKLTTKLKQAKNLAPLKDAFANWIIKVELSDPSQLDNLMDAKAYEEFCANE